MWRRWFALMLVPGLLLATGCKGTGLGWIQSALAPGEKATFGFSFVVQPLANGDTTGGTAGFSGAYRDPQGMLVGGKVVEVAFKGTGVLKNTPPPAELSPAYQGCMLGIADYESQNPNVPGRGTVELLLCDRGNGPSSGDFVSVDVLSGPYMPYHNGGVAQGNITVNK